MTVDTIFIGVTHDVTYTGAKLAADGTVLDAGTCTWELFQADRATSIETGTLSGGAGGNYAGKIAPAVTSALARGKQYWLLVGFSQADAADNQWILCEPDYRP